MGEGATSRGRRGEAENANPARGRDRPGTGGQEAACSHGWRRSRRNPGKGRCCRRATAGRSPPRGRPEARQTAASIGKRLCQPVPGLSPSKGQESRTKGDRASSPQVSMATPLTRFRCRASAVTAGGTGWTRAASGRSRRTGGWETPGTQYPASAWAVRPSSSMGKEASRWQPVAGRPGRTRSGVLADGRTLGARAQVPAAPGPGFADLWLRWLWCARRGDPRGRVFSFARNDRW